MTITYLNGTVLEAVVLSHEENAIRAIVPGCDGVLVFTCVHGTWISEEIEPVAIEFAWQRRGTSPASADSACICHKTLAARLIQSLFRGCEPMMAEPATLYVFSPEGERVPIGISQLPQLCLRQGSGCPSSAAGRARCPLSSAPGTLRAVGPEIARRPTELDSIRAWG